GAGLCLFILSCAVLGCGTGPGTSHDGENGSGGAGTGGTASGGSSSGGSPSGGSSSGGSESDGSGGAVCPDGPDGNAPVEYPACRGALDCIQGGMCLSAPPSGAGLCGACFPTTIDCT